MEKKVDLQPHLINTLGENFQGTYARTFLQNARNEEEEQTRGELAALIILQTGVLDFPFEQAVFQLWEEFCEAYYQSERGNPPEALSEARERTFIWAEASFRQARDHEEAPLPLIKMNLAAFAIWGDFVYGIGDAGIQGGLFEEGSFESIPLKVGDQLNRRLEGGERLFLLTASSLQRVGSLQSIKDTPQLREQLLASPSQADVAALVIEVGVLNLPDEGEVMQIEGLADARPNIAQFLSNRLARVKDLLPSLWFKERTLPGDALVEPATIPGSRLKLKISILLLLLLILAAGTSYWRQTQHDNQQQVVQLIQKARDYIINSSKIQESDPEQASQLLNQADQILGEIRELKISEKIGADQELRVEIEKGYDQLYQTIRLQAKPLTIAPSELTQTYAYRRDQGVVRLDEGKEAVIAIRPELAWQEIVDLKTYLGNVYLLDPKANQIHKYVVVESDFSRRLDYFPTLSNIDLSGAVSMAIDGDLYLLSGDKRVERYQGGERMEFSLSGFFPPLEEAGFIYTDIGQKRLYLVQDQSVLYFDKEGKYQGRWAFEGLDSEIKRVFVDEASGLIYLTTTDETYFQANFAP